MGVKFMRANFVADQNTFTRDDFSDAA